MSSERTVANRLLRVRLCWFAATVAAISVSVFLWCGECAVAGTGRVQKISNPISPIYFELDGRWADGNGLRPLRVRVHTGRGGAAPFDRTFKVRLTPESRQYGAPRNNYIAYLELKQGATSGEVVVPVIQREQFRSVNISFEENGQPIRWASASFIVGASNSEDHSEVYPTLLFIHSNAPTREQREKILDQRRTGQLDELDLGLPRWPAMSYLLRRSPRTSPFRGNDLGLLDLLNANEGKRTELMPFEEVPKVWSQLSCFDLVFISLDDLQDFVKEEPQRWASLRRWIEGGASLYVYGVGDHFERLEELDAILAGEKEDLAADVWKRVYTDKNLTQVTGIRQDRNRNRRNTRLKQAAAAKANAKSTVPIRHVRRRNLGLGRVLAVGPEDPFSMSVKDRVAILNAVGSENWNRTSRHGISLSRVNDGFWKYLIPGVGLPPVNSFLVMISLFVIVIGPLNYWFLRRINRLYLLLVTFPAAAILVTVALMSYALITDGFGVRARIRSVTYLDQRHETAVSVSTQTYYASVAPSDGLVYPRESLVFPVVHHRERDRRRRGHNETMVWDSQQKFQDGYIFSRRFSQFLVQHAESSGMRLNVKWNEDGSPPTVTNLLGSPISHLALRAPEGGAFFWGAGLDDEESRVLEPINLVDLSAKLKTLQNNNVAQFPEGFDPGDYGRYAYGRRYYYNSGVDQGFPAPDTSNGVLERTISGIYTNPTQTILPGRYVAAVEHSSAVPIGVRKLKTESGFQVILGRWR